MEEAYKNWKLLLESEDIDNVVLALNITSGLEIDKNTIELDVLAAYFYLVYKKYNHSTEAEEIVHFIDWGKKNGIRFCKQSDMPEWWKAEAALNVMDKVLALNPRIDAMKIYQHSLCTYRDLFEYFVENGKHERLDSDSWLACFIAHNFYRADEDKVALGCTYKKMPDIVFSWHAITHLTVHDYLFKPENLTLLYQLKNLEVLQTYGFKMAQSAHFDFNRLPKLRKFSLYGESGYHISVATGDYLTILTLYTIREAELEKILACTPNLKRLTINKYQGNKLPQNISQLQHLEELSMQEVNKRIDLTVLKNLPKLAVLNLQASRFTQLPLLANLVNLNISYCDLDALPFALGKMPHLEQLHINNNRILFFKPALIRQLLGQLKTLNIQSAFASEKIDAQITEMRQVYK